MAVPMHSIPCMPVRRRPAPFPNTDPAIFADFGETMAEARGRISCATDCAAITPTVDVILMMSGPTMRPAGEGRTLCLYLR